MIKQTPSAPFNWRAFLQSPAGVAVCLAAFGLGAYLLLEHSGHIGRLLPYLLLAACPLMHVFMMRGMHGGHQHGAAPATSPHANAGHAQHDAHAGCASPATPAPSESSRG
ncbi:MAG TPA: DUF2933 domain-containing protein [Deinococcales bacterium]|nr:DUF2933 domain-containing protein [Deinococcales bacterium]